MAFSGLRTKLMLGALALGLFVVSGCLGGGGSLTNLPTNETAFVKLKIRLGRVDTRTDVDSGGISLKKGSSLQIQTLIIKFTSNLSDTVCDTVTALEQGLSTTGFLGDSVLVNVSLRALRWWNIAIETRDQNDSIVHQGTSGSYATQGAGQIMDITLPVLTSRYLSYEARYVLPEVIYAKGLADTQRVSQRIYFCELVLQIDGDTIRDSSSFNPNITSPGARFIYADPSKLKNSLGKMFFKPNGKGNDTATHVQSYEYVRAGSHEFKMSAYGYLEGDSIGRTPRLLFQGKDSIDVLKTGVPEETAVKLDWIGPGSSLPGADTAKGPGSGNWNGIFMTVNIGKVKGGKATIGVISDVDGL